MFCRRGIQGFARTDMADKKTKSAVKTFAPLAGIFKSISFTKMREMVEALINKEFQYGILRDDPDIILDLAITDHSGTASCDMWDSRTGKTVSVPYGEIAGRLRRFAGEGLSKAAVLLPSSSPFGSLAVTRFVSIHKNPETEITDTELASAFAKNLNLDLEEMENSPSYIVCEETPSDIRYFISTIPGDVQFKLEESVILDNTLGDEVTAVRAMDRIIPLSNYLVSLIPEDIYTNMFLCLEQRGNNLFIWNLHRLSNGLFVPIASETKKIPLVETHDGLVNIINLLEHEMVRIKNYQAPERVLIVSDGRPMLDGLFKTVDLINVCRDVLNFEAERSDDVKVFECENAAIAGTLLMEDRIVKNFTDIQKRLGA